MRQPAVLGRVLMGPEYTVVGVTLCIYVFSMGSSRAFRWYSACPVRWRRGRARKVRVFLVVVALHHVVAKVYQVLGGKTSGVVTAAKDLGGTGVRFGINQPRNALSKNNHQPHAASACCGSARMARVSPGLLCPLRVCQFDLRWRERMTPLVDRTVHRLTAGYVRCTVAGGRC